MSNLTAQPQLMNEAAANVAGIRSAIAEANAAAAGPTTGLAAAAADEVSAATAALFGSYAQDYQAVISQATAFQEEFAAALAAAGSAYSGTELAIAGALGSLTSPIQSLFGGGGAGAPAAAAVDFALIMTGSGTAIPSIPYMNSVLPYIEQAFTPGTLLPLNTPEGLYPLTAVKDLPLTVSVNTGVQILNNALFGPQGLITGAPPFGGHTVNVLGYSQSGIISSLELRALAAMGSPNTADLSFTILGNPMNPNGGLFARFPGLQLPSLGLDLYGAMPSHTGYTTNTYTLQYDGYADFPKYPINLLADLNAFAGIQFVHGTYPQLNPASLPAGYNMVQLPTTDPLNNFYMITYPNLPLLTPLRALPLIGNPLADLIQPDLKMLINLGYGSDPNLGYSTGYADVGTPFGLFPSVNPVSLAGSLASGAQQGVGAFVGDLSGVGAPSASGLSLAALLGSGGTGGPGLLASLAAPASPADSFIQSLQTLNTNVTSTFTNAAANIYAVALPTADIANALVTSIPSYDVNLVLSGVQQVIDGDPLGGLAYALVAPVAADTALVTLAGGFEVNVLINAVAAVV